MPGARSYPSPALVRRYVAAAREAGLEPGGIEVAPDGTLRVLPKPAVVANDDALFEQWKDRV